MGPAPAADHTARERLPLPLCAQRQTSRERLNSILRTMLDVAQQRKIPRTNIIVDVDAMSLA